MARVWFNEENVRKMADRIDDLLAEAGRLREFLRDNLDAIIERGNSEEYAEYAEEYGLEEGEWLDRVGSNMNDVVDVLDKALDEAWSVGDNINFALDDLI
jgi:hypothetical protein